MVLSAFFSPVIFFFVRQNPNYLLSKPGKQVASPVCLAVCVISPVLAPVAEFLICLRLRLLDGQIPLIVVTGRALLLLK